MSSWTPRKDSKAALFLELAQPDSLGYSDEVPIDRFVDRYAKLQMGNGGDWCRDSSSLGRRFNIARHKVKGKIVSVSLEGYRKVSTSKPIPSDVRKKMKTERCSILQTGNPEVDHKDGRLDDPRLADIATVREDDFQPLSKAANNAKRQHCRECRDSHMRFDATKLGYPVPQWRGQERYNGTCVGCYWHDPKKFNIEVTKHHPASHQ